MEPGHSGEVRGVEKTDVKEGGRKEVEGRQKREEQEGAQPRQTLNQ